MMTDADLNARIDRLHAHGIVDMHYDMPMDLYEKRGRENVIATDYLPELEAGGIGVLGVAIYLEDQYLPEMGLRVALDQIARLYAETERTDRLTICRSYDEIVRAREAQRIALLITMEGVDPLGTDLNLLRVFYELGLRSVGLTHGRRNFAANGAAFAPSGSAPGGLTGFGRELVRECERLGIMIDLAHINPKGFEEIVALATKPVIVSHSNARRYFDIERNVSDEQIRMVGERGGVIGVNAVLVSPTKQDATLDRYVDHIEHMVSLIGVDGVGIGFDFFEFIFNAWPEAEREAFQAHFASVNFVPDLGNHSHARNLTRRLIERGWRDEEIEKLLYRNWMRVFGELL